jgi:hypothetical protein
MPSWITNCKSPPPPKQMSNDQISPSNALVLYLQLCTAQLYNNLEKAPMSKLGRYVCKFIKNCGKCKGIYLMLTLLQ